MRRSVLATMLVLALAGCVPGRFTRPEVKYSLPPASLEPLPPLRETINRGLAPIDPNAHPAGHTPAPAPS
ncbi:MAG: hypothetical protein IRY99_13180, partial [Isosphaeraceae bacterium]|nr:hypothetical protein [Isosphaeraceae bacterium]